jgi:hypothetical protein
MKTSEHLGKMTMFFSGNFLGAGLVANHVGHPLTERFLTASVVTALAGITTEGCRLLRRNDTNATIKLLEQNNFPNQARLIEEGPQPTRILLYSNE